MTTTGFAIDVFYTDVVTASNGSDITIVAVLNGERHVIGSARKLRNNGYTFLGYTGTQFPKALEAAADSLDWFKSDAEECGGLKLAEVRQRAATLAGIWLAGQAIA